MMQRLATATLMLALLLPAPGSAARRGRTDLAALQEYLEELTVDRSGFPGQWLARYEGTRIQVFAHEGKGRMRVQAPVASASDLDSAGLRTLLEANYDRALDARYAVHDGTVWALFIHPLEPLTREELENGLEAVVNLRRNYGDSFASGPTRFGVPPPGLR